jgi:hypothetical protein
LLDWSILAERRIGGDDDGPTSFYRLRTAAVDADAAGRLYVLDNSNARVVAFAADGEVRWVAGRRGGGPGEFRSANSLAVTRDGNVLVHDPNKLSLVRFDSTGGTLPEVPFLYGIVRAWDPHVLSFGSALAVLSRHPYAGSDNRPVDLLRISDVDSTTLLRVETPLSRTANYPECGITVTMPVLFGTRLVWDGNGSTIAIVSSPEYVIDVFDELGRRTSIRRDIAPVAVTESEALATVRTRRGGPFTCNAATPEQRLANHGYASHYQLVSALALAPDGGLWVGRRSRPEDEVAIDIFNDEADYVGTLPLGSPFPVVFLAGGRIGYIETDSVDVQRLVVARLVR